MRKRIFISNCEGTISKNNNTLDLIKHYVPEGDRVLDAIDSYCLINAQFTHKKDVHIAQPMKLVLPFLLAFGANNKSVEDFSCESLVLSDYCKESLNYIKDISNAFIFSTSYEHHLRAICKETGFPLENTISTKVNLDKFVLSEKEITKLKSIAWEIGGMTPMKIPSNATSIKEFSLQDQMTMKRLDQLFWGEVAKNNCKSIFSDVHVVTEADKANTVQTISNSLSSRLDEFMYVGSTATDVAPMKLIHSDGGFVVSLVGEPDTVRNSGITILSDNYAAIGVFADLFLRFGQAEAGRVAGNFDKNALWMTAVEPTMLNQVTDIDAKSWPKVFAVSEFSVETVVGKVEEYKKKAQEKPEEPKIDTPLTVENTDIRKRKKKPTSNSVLH